MEMKEGREEEGKLKTEWKMEGGRRKKRAIKSGREHLKGGLH